MRIFGNKRTVFHSTPVECLLIQQTFTKCLNVPVTVEAPEVQRRIVMAITTKNTQSGRKDRQ